MKNQRIILAPVEITAFEAVPGGNRIRVYVPHFVTHLAEVRLDEHDAEPTVALSVFSRELQWETSDGHLGVTRDGWDATDSFGIELSRELGSRTVIDGTTGLPVPSIADLLPHRDKEGALKEHRQQGDYAIWSL